MGVKEGLQVDQKLRQKQAKGRGPETPGNVTPHRHKKNYWKGGFPRGKTIRERAGEETTKTTPCLFGWFVGFFGFLFICSPPNQTKPKKEVGELGGRPAPP